MPAKKGKCPVCDNASPRDLEKIKIGFEEGKTPETLAGKFRQSFDDMAHHCSTCLTVAELPSMDTQLQRVLDIAISLAETSNDEYQRNPSKAGLLLSVNRSLTEVRDTVKQLQSAQKGDPEEILREITKQALNPILSAGMRSLTEELAKARADLLASGASPEAVAAMQSRVIAAYSQVTKAASHSAAERIGALLKVPAKRVRELLGKT